MKRIEIEINGEAYPCMPTMGAMLRFKTYAGHDVTQMDGQSVSDVLTYLYCCVQSACAREGKPFDMSLMEFADAITDEEVTGWAEHLNADGEEKETKKKVPKVNRK